MSRLYSTCIPPVSHRILGIPLYPCIYLHLAILQQIHCIPLYPTAVCIYFNICESLYYFIFELYLYVRVSASASAKLMLKNEHKSNANAPRGAAFGGAAVPRARACRTPTVGQWVTSSCVACVCWPACRLSVLWVWARARLVCFLIYMDMVYVWCAALCRDEAEA